MSTPNYPPPPPSTPPPSPADSTKTVMVVLSYLWLLALIPFLVEKQDSEVRWHAKHGLVITAAEFIVWIVLHILVVILPVLGAIAGCLSLPVIVVVFLVIRILAIVKGLKGERFIVPVLSQYADKF
jgi:uncharacterized membrane protein